MTGPNHLLYFPRGDRELEALTEAALARYEKAGLRDEALAFFVTAELQDHFPDAIIRTREPLAGTWPEDTAWYIYRDGRPVAEVERTAEGTTRRAEVDEAETVR